MPPGELWLRAIENRARTLGIAGTQWPLFLSWLKRRMAWKIVVAGQESEALAQLDLLTREFREWALNQDESSLRPRSRKRKVVRAGRRRSR